MINALFDLRPWNSSQLLADIGSLVTAGGFLSVITTPLGFICAWMMRKRLNPAVGGLAKVLTAVAAFGLIALILRYANPFFKGY